MSDSNPPITLGEAVDRVRLEANCEASAATARVVADVIHWNLAAEGVPVQWDKIVPPMRFVPIPAEFWPAVQTGGMVDAERSAASVGSDGFRHIRILRPPKPASVTPHRKRGRPPSEARLLIDAEAARRAEAGIRKPSAYAEADELDKWQRQTHPTVTPLMVKSIRNGLYPKWLGDTAQKSD